MSKVSGELADDGTVGRFAHWLACKRLRGVLPKIPTIFFLLIIITNNIAMTLTKYILNPYPTLGDSVLLQPIAKATDRILVCDFPELFDADPTVGAVHPSEIRGDDVLNMGSVLGGFNLDAIYAVAGLPNVLSPRLYTNDSPSIQKGHVGIGWRNRNDSVRYPYLRLLISYLQQRGYTIHCFDVSHPHEQAGVENHIGLSIPRLMAMIAGCEMFLSVDTGLAHIAAALGVPTLICAQPHIEPLYRCYPQARLLSAPSLKTLSVRKQISALSLLPERQLYVMPSSGRMLPNVTLALIEDINIERADYGNRLLHRMAGFFEFGAIKLLTSFPVDSAYTVRIPPLRGYEAYARFCLTELHQYVDTDFLMLCQADGYIVNPDKWDDDFLKYDWLGAPWDRGLSPMGSNGGFNIRSKKLMKRVAEIPLPNNPERRVLFEDRYIAVDLGQQLIDEGIRFAPRPIQERFSVEVQDYGIPSPFGFHSYITWNLPKNSHNFTIFHHSGDLGDIIYSLPTVKAMGGGILILSPDTGEFNTRLPMDKARYNFIKPLLMDQPYLFEVVYAHQKYPNVDIDLNRFRERLESRSSIQCLTHYYFDEFGLSKRLDRHPWLSVDAELTIKDKPIVINRSPRYQNPDFPWDEVLSRYQEQAIFVGLPSEHRAFCNEFGHVDYFATETSLDLARVIAGGELFIGNQSFAYSIAEGIKKNTIQEVCPYEGNCIFKRGNAQYFINSGIRGIRWPKI